MGSLFKSKTKVTQAPFESNPWEPQQPFLLEGFEQGSDALTNALKLSGGIKDFAADLNPGQLNAIGSLSKMGMGQAQDAAGAMMNAGMPGVQNIAAYGQQAQDFMDYAQSDRMGQIMDRGGQFADNPYLQDQIDAALGDVRRNFDLQRGQINSGAVSTGNMASSRTGVLDALAADDAMDRAADVSSSMRYGAYENGLNRAMQMDQQGIADRLAALGALSSSGAQSLDTLNAGLNTSAMGFNQALDANTILQGQAQNEIDGQRQMSREQMDLIRQYMQIVGGNYGQKGFNSQVTQSASPFQQLAGAAIGLAGAF